jgi:L-lactate utilization protein LutB
MSSDLPIWILEPELEDKISASAGRLSDRSKHSQPAAGASPVEDVKQRLRELRLKSRDNITGLTAKLLESLKNNHPELRVKSAADSSEAVGYIAEISDGIKIVSINNSSVINREIQPGLEKNDFRVINSYLNEYDVSERKIQDYWDLPRFLDRNLLGTFGVAAKLAGTENPDDAESSEYIAVLGVNAVSAEDGTVFFLEHYRNIFNDLTRARKIVLIISLDKIVETRDEADFQTKCMGIFGMENVVLSIKPKPAGTQSIADLELPSGAGDRELHVIILDNGRTELAKGKFSDLFLCIGCRACNKHCPIQHSFTDVSYIWSPRNYLDRFISGESNSIDTCLHCEACRLECPVDIDLPHLMWQAKLDYVSNHGTSFSHKILGAPERLARLATPFAPLANLMMKTGLVRVPMEAITGIDRKTVLPVFHTATFKKRFGKNG